MRAAKLVSAILVLSILLLGCSAKSETNVNASVNGSAGTPPATPPAQPPSAPPSAPPQAPPSAPPTSPPPSGTAGTYAGLSYEALVALGVPLECTITTTSNGTTTSSTVFMKGTAETRIEVLTGQTGSGSCAKVVMISKDKKLYMSCDGKSEFFPGADCKWLMFETSGNGTLATDVSTGSGSVNTDYSNVDPSQIDCKAWVYNADAFDVDGKVCDFSNMMNN